MSKNDRKKKKKFEIVKKTKKESVILQIDHLKMYWQCILVRKVVL